MRVGVVTEVVQQRRGEHGHHVLFSERARDVRIAQQAKEKPLRAPIDAQAVLEARVHGAGVDEVCRAELSDAAQALEGGVVDDALNPGRERDVSQLGDAYRARGGAELRGKIRGAPFFDPFGRVSV